MDYIFVLKDKTGRSIHLSKERWKHILRHPNMEENRLETIKDTIINSMVIRYFEEDEDVRYFYKHFKNNPIEERYLLVSVKYLNGEGFIITSFFTDKITGIKWQI